MNWPRTQFYATQGGGPASLAGPGKGGGKGGMRYLAGPVLLFMLGGCQLALGFSPSFVGGSVTLTPETEGYLVTGAPLYYGQIRAPHIILTGCFPTDTYTCALIRITEIASDEEFWQFEARIKIRSGFGIPYGRAPVDFLIVGSQHQCEETRALLSLRGTPTEPCRGPHFFKRI